MLTKKEKYRIYIDEVGNSDLGAATEDPNHRFLSLTGVVFELAYAADVLNPRIEGLKKTYFKYHPDEPFVFHRKELLNGHPPFEALRDVSVRAAFDADLLDMIQTLDYTVLTVVIDKLLHKQQYAVWRYDPYHYCLAVLLERFVLFLERIQARGDVMAESRGGKEDMRLKRSFGLVFESGTDYVTSERFAHRLTSRQLKLKNKSNNIAGLQFCDLIAHPSRRRILCENHLIDDSRTNLFSDKIADAIESKYDRDGKKIFGKKLLP